MKRMICCVGPIKEKMQWWMTKICVMWHWLHKNNETMDWTLVYTAMIKLSCPQIVLLHWRHIIFFAYNSRPANDIPLMCFMVHLCFDSENHQYTEMEEISLSIEIHLISCQMYKQECHLDPISEFLFFYHTSISYDIKMCVCVCACVIACVCFLDTLQKRDHLSWSVQDISIYQCS